MGTETSIGRRNAQLSAQPFGFALALLGLWCVIGCDRSSDQDLASRGVEATSVPLELAPVVKGDGDIVNTKDPAGSDGVVTVPSQPQPPLKPLAAPPARLGIGDASPGLHVAKWIKGEPVDEILSGNKVHVVEFWATWCGPCRVGMPHISELQSEYPDEVAFIGVTREDEAVVTTFLQSPSSDGRPWQEVIQYRLAIDDRDWTNTAYMQAAGQNGIPCAFVVGRDGVVDWIGHPAGIDEPLKQIVNGTWDREAAIVEYKQQERLKELSTQIGRLVRLGDWDRALEVLDTFELESGKSKSLLDFRVRLLESAGRVAEASAVRTTLVDEVWDDPNLLNEIAWKIATNRKTEDLDLALKAARRASELREDKSPQFLDTVARCYYRLGNLDEAIRWQRLAVEYGGGVRGIETTLNHYLAEQAESEKSEPDASSSLPESSE